MGSMGKTMAALDIHNVRFYDFTPKAIHCMAYNEEKKQLAVSRADNSIELWNCHHKPCRERVIPGNPENSVEALLWCGKKLLSAGLHGFVTEHNLQTYQVQSTVAVTGGPVWCLALSPDKKKLAAGTEEGYICLLDVTAQGLIYDKTLEKQEGRVLSIAWHENGEYLVTGSVDVVRLWSLSKGQISRFAVGRTSRKKETIVWCVSILPDMTIITGDSRGRTSWWKGSLGTLLCSVATHKADVLSLQVAKDHKSVFVSGVDPTIVQVNKVETKAGSGKAHCWVKALTRIIHTHDVRAMALTADDKLFSGGVDTNLALSYYPPKTVIRFPAMPVPGWICTASKGRCVALCYSNVIELWRLGDSNHEATTSNMFLQLSQDRVKLLEMQTHKGEMLHWCSISPQALWVAYLTPSKMRIFRFYPPHNGSRLSVRRVRAIGDDIEVSQQLLWLDEGVLASANCKQEVQILCVTEVEATLERTISLTSNAKMMAVDNQSKFLGIVDNNNKIVVYNISNWKETFLPHYKSCVSAFAINGSNSCVVVVYADMTVVEYDLIKGNYTPFSRQFMDNTPIEWKKRNLVIHSISFITDQPNLIFLHDDQNINVINKDSKVDTAEGKPSKIARRQNNSNQEETSSNSTGVEVIAENITVIKRPNQVLHFSQLEDSSAVSVDLNPLVLLDKLPPAFRQKKFGGV
ncbi:UTP4 small subunit processome component l(3)72Dn [Oratosquilla oratoria]|uniref:UTP4 small subunit processome component l(3)72Dn n=1 Tax=Oratosquilla oratoria TaxID=337810 RepID=UPI003F75E1CE